MSVLPFTPRGDPRREAARTAMHAAIRLSCRAQAHHHGSGTYAAVVRARMEARAAMAECDRLALTRGRP